MAKTIKMTLDVASINKAIRQLNNYRDNTLPKKIREFVSALADIGIQVAAANMGEFDGYVEFRKDLYGSVDRYSAILVGADLGGLLIRWLGDRGGYEISPIAMAEFGSGWLSEVNFEKMNGTFGQGTMPNARGHAFDTYGWGWKDLEKPHAYHRSMGYAPTHPLYNAWLEMEKQIEQVALKVFGKR